ncbi:hypothetical protein ACIO3O_34575 [Streptomyces sp. NPDC087440]|uniref:hypothetical protein n=1 Tax=Streptomyces sp. NPDC087440 TaxID=3365790 RepID=UPI003814C6F2
MKKEFMAPHGRLTERHIQVLDRLAKGDTGPQTALVLGLTPTQVGTARLTCNKHIGVDGRSALVHASYLLGILARPAHAGPLPSTGVAVVDTDSDRVLELLASGATGEQAARRLQLSESAWWFRVGLLKVATKAVSTHHLITQGWRHHVLGPEHVHMTSGPPLVPAPRRPGPPSWPPRRSGR